MPLRNVEPARFMHSALTAAGAPRKRPIDLPTTMASRRSAAASVSVLNHASTSAFRVSKLPPLICQRVIRHESCQVPPRVPVASYIHFVDCAPIVPHRLHRMRYLALAPCMASERFRPDLNTPERLITVGRATEFDRPQRRGWSRRACLGSRQPMAGGQPLETSRTGTEEGGQQKAANERRPTMGG